MPLMITFSGQFNKISVTNAIFMYCIVYHIAWTSHVLIAIVLILLTKCEIRIWFVAFNIGKRLTVFVECDKVLHCGIIFFLDVLNDNSFFSRNANYILLHLMGLFQNGKRSKKIIDVLVYLSAPYTKTFNEQPGSVISFKAHCLLP